MGYWCRDHVMFALESALGSAREATIRRAPRSEVGCGAKDCIQMADYLVMY